MDRNSRADGTAFIRRGEAWSEVTELAPSSFRVRLGGTFRGAWLASLSRRLAERHLSVDHLHARRNTEQLWIAELHLLTLPRALDPLALDYSALAEDPDPASLPAFELDTYRLIDSRDYGGTLMLTLEAKDSLGLLGSLLGHLAELGLFPDELHIETHDGHAYDSLWLSATGGLPPSAAARDAAARLLNRACKARA